MNQMNEIRIDEINEDETPQNLNNHNFYFDDVDNIITKLSLRIITNLINYRLDKVQKSNLYNFLFMYSQIQITNKKKNIFIFILKNIFNTLDDLINDPFILLSFNNNDLYNINNLIFYKWFTLNNNIKDIIKFKLIEEFLYINDYRQYEANLTHFIRPRSAFIRFYNRTNYMEKEFKQLVNYYIMNDRITLKINDIINNEYIKGLFIYLLNHNLNNMLWNDTDDEEEEEPEQEPEPEPEPEPEEEDNNNFDFFELSYNYNPDPEEETEEKQKEKINKIIKDNYILINHTNLLYFDYTNITNYIKFYKILKVNKECSLCLENNNNVYRFQALGGCCSCPSLWCLDCLLYNNYKNNKNNIMSFKCLICKKDYINYGKLELNYNHLILCGYYEQIKKDIFKQPYKISTINSFNNYEDVKEYIKESIKYHSFNITDFSKLIYNDVKQHYKMLYELKNKVFYKEYDKIILFNNNNKSLLTKKKKYNKIKIRKVNINILINLLENYKNLIRINYEMIKNDKILLYNYELLIFETIRRD